MSRLCTQLLYNSIVIFLHDIFRHRYSTLFFFEKLIYIYQIVSIAAVMDGYCSSTHFGPKKRLKKNGGEILIFLSPILPPLS